jgi:hypothetical protein
VFCGLLLCLLLVACAASPPDASDDEGDLFDAASLVSLEHRQLMVVHSGRTDTPEPLGSGLTDQGGIASRKIARKARQRIEVEDLTNSAASAVAIAEAIDGAYIERFDVRTRTARILLRVPAAQFEATLGKLAALGVELERTVSVDDVTTRYADLEAKIGNLRALRDRLVKLLEVAETVKQRLEIEVELARVQMRLDAHIATLANLAARIALSPIDVRLVRRRVLGPLGALGYGAYWIGRKSIILRD